MIVMWVIWSWNGLKKNTANVKQQLLFINLCDIIPMKENQHRVKIRIQIVLNLDKMCAETQIFRDTYGKTAANSVDIAQVRAYENPDHIYWKLTIFIAIY